MKQKSLRVSIFDFPLAFLQQSNYTFTPLAIFIVPSTGNAVMENKIKSAMEIEGESGNYLQISFSRAPKKNQEALAQLGKRWVQWLNKHGVSSKIYYLDNSSSGTRTTREEVPPEGVESIAKILSVSDDEMLGVSLQFYRDQAHANKVFAKMMQDETCGAIGKEFDSLVTQGKGMITDGFSRLRV
jgi:large subunit ribosomal protein L17